MTTTATGRYVATTQRGQMRWVAGPEDHDEDETVRYVTGAELIDLLELEHADR